MNSIRKTEDGSHTIYSDMFNEHYHSTHGAINESRHVFIEAGLNYCQQKNIKIFEVGFGTGLNAILSYIESKKRNLTVQYTAIDLYPVTLDLINKLHYQDFLTAQQFDIFNLMHTSNWNNEIKLDEKFSLLKIKSDLINYNFAGNYDIIYFDAFAPDTQPEMWSSEIFQKIYNALNNIGILTTYSSKGLVKNNLRNAGFTVKRLPGPTGKRHMLRAVKI